MPLAVRVRCDRPRRSSAPRRGWDAALIAALTAVLLGVTLLSGLPVLARPGRHRAGGIAAAAEPLASGVFLGAGLVHMLPEAAEGFAAAGLGAQWPFAACGAVLLALAGSGRSGEASPAEASGRVPALITTGVLCVHSVLAGASFGVGGGGAAVVALFLALVAHKGAASFALAVVLDRSPIAPGRTIGLFITFAACLPLGVVVGQAAIGEAPAVPLLVPVIQALGAGTFLHLATSHGCSRQGTGIVSATLAGAAGFALMVAVASVV